MDENIMYLEEEINWTMRRVGLAKYLRIRILEDLREEHENFISNLSDTKKTEEAIRRG